MRLSRPDLRLQRQMRANSGAAERSRRMPGPRLPDLESMGLAWIWMGDPALADTSKIYDLPQYHAQMERGGRRRTQDRLPLSQPCGQSVRSGACQLRASVDARQFGKRGHSGSQREPGDKFLTWRWIIERRPFRCSRNSGISPAMSIAGIIITTPRRISRWSISAARDRHRRAGRPRENGLQIFACHFSRRSTPTAVWTTGCSSRISRPTRRPRRR